MKFLQTIFVLKPNIFSLLQLSVSLGSILDYMLIQHWAYILAKFGYKNNLVGVREASCLALKYFDHRKHPILVSTTTAENCPQVAFKYPLVSFLQMSELSLELRSLACQPCRLTLPPLHYIPLLKSGHEHKSLHTYKCERVSGLQNCELIIQHASFNKCIVIQLSFVLMLIGRGTQLMYVTVVE